VFCEKPMVCTIARAKRVVAKVKKTRLKLQVGYGRKASPGIQFVRDHIHSGKLGKLNFVSIVLGQDWLYSQKGTWRQKLALSGGGQLNDSGSHMIDMLLWLLNQKPVSVAAFTDNRGTEVDIDSTTNIRFDKGALGSMAIIASAAQWFEKWVFVGSKATLIMEDDLVRVEVNGKPKPVRLPKKKQPTITINWIDAICGKAKLLSPAEHGLNIIKLTESIWKSAEANGKPIQIR